MQPKLEMMFKDNRRSAQCQLQHFSRLTSAEVSRVLTSVEKRYVPYTEPLQSRSSRLLEDFVELPPAVLSLIEFSRANSPRDEDYARYNAELKLFYDAYESYLKDLREHEALVGRTAPLELKLLNAGETIARDVMVTLRLPHGFTLYSEAHYPKRPTEPCPPEKPAPIYERMVRGTLPVQKVMVPDIKIDSPGESLMSDLTIRRADGYDVSFRVRKIQQQDRLMVGKFFVVFPTADKARSFQIEYQVHGANHDLIKSGTLEIKVLGPRS